MSYKILLVDDDPLSLVALQYQLEYAGYKVDALASAEEARAAVGSGKQEYALAILDYQLGNESGSELANSLRSLSPKTYMLIYSGDPSREAVKSSWEAGAVGFVEKGTDSLLLLNTVRSWCRKYEETYQTVSLAGCQSEYSAKISSIGLVGRSAGLAAVVEKALRYAPLKETVLILGETGTGKEKIARALHAKSPESFYVVNCAAYNGTAELLESELFGYTKGAFTGAQKDHAGIFESAEGGTVFLDEVHTLDVKAQQKLLRVLQEKKVRRIGTTKEVKVDFRLVVAAKPELEEMVQDGTFLADLFERLNVLQIRLSPLRERPEDVEPLVAFFCERYERETGQRKRFRTRTVRYLEKYPWPRNVRELENLVRRLCIDSTTEDIVPEHLDPRFFETSSPVTTIKDRVGGVLKNELIGALQTSGSQREAARKLGMPESTLRRLKKKFEIEA